MIKKAFGDQLNFYQTILAKIEKADPKKIFRDTGKLLRHDYRNWIKTSFLADFNRLVCNKIVTIQVGTEAQSTKGTK
jgi:uncharacterized protein (DUF2147 family)